MKKTPSSCAALLASAGLMLALNGQALATCGEQIERTKGIQAYGFISSYAQNQNSGADPEFKWETDPSKSKYYSNITDKKMHGSNCFCNVDKSNSSFKLDFGSNFNRTAMVTNKGETSLTGFDPGSGDSVMNNIFQSSNGQG